MFEETTHPCEKDGCDIPVPYDDEPFCYEHTPEGKSSMVPGYSYKAKHPAPTAASMMERDRFAMVVIVDLDPVPGAFHTKEDAKQRIEAMLLNNIGHYHPVVMPFDE